MANFKDELFKEAGEAVAHELVGNEIRAAAAAGESDVGIAGRVLKALANPAGPMMTFARVMPGFALPLAGVAIGHLLSKTDFLDNVLPDDARPVVRQAKALLKTAGPGIIVGALSGYRDAAEDIDRELAKVRSEAGVPVDRRTGTLDTVAWTRLFPQRIFVIARDTAGNFRFENGVPVVNDPDLISMKGLWDETHRPGTREEGEGRNRRRVNVPGVPFPLEPLSFEEAVARTGGRPVISSKDMAELMRRLEKPKEWMEQAGPDVRTLLLNLACSLRALDPLGYDLAEDHIKDIVGKGSIPFLKDVAARFNPRAVGGRFSRDDVDDLLAAFDTALGSELTASNKMRRWIRNRWNQVGTFPVWLKMIARFAIVLLLAGMTFTGMAVIYLFLSSFWWVIQGAFMPYDVIYQTPQTFGPFQFYDSRWLAAALMGVGGSVIVVLLFTLRIPQRIFQPILGRLFNLREDWLAEFGWRFTALFIPVFIFVIAALLFRSSVAARVICLAFSFLGLAILKGLKVVAYNARSDWMREKVDIKIDDIALAGVLRGWLILFAILGIDFAYRQWVASATGAADPLVTGTVQAVGSSATSIWAFLGSKHVLAIAVRFILAALTAALVIVGVKRLITTVWPIGVVLAVLVMLVTFYPWLGMPDGKYVPFADKPAATTTSKAPVELSSTPAKASTSQPKRQPASSSTQDDAVNCAELSYELRVEHGCQ